MGPIGIFDSGMGGLTVLRELHRRLPAEDLLYFGDTARVPYGTKGVRTVREFACQDAAFLASHGVKMIIVACNTASAFALDHLRESFAQPVLGVIEPGVETAARVTRGGSIGVIGTPGTVASGRYQDGLAEAVPGAEVIARECPLFVPLAEEGLVEHAITELAVAEYLTPLREAGVDTLILGCTHYPLLKPAIARFMGPGTTLVDSAEALAEAAADRLEDEGLARPEDAPTGRLDFYLSDLPWKFTEAGERFLGQPIGDVTTVNLNEVASDGGLDYQRKECP